VVPPILLGFLRRDGKTVFISAQESCVRHGIDYYGIGFSQID
jgi:hypothetical protein